MRGVPMPPGVDRAAHALDYRRAMRLRWLDLGLCRDCGKPVAVLRSEELGADGQFVVSETRMRQCQYHLDQGRVQQAAHRARRAKRREEEAAARAGEGLPPLRES